MSDETPSPTKPTSAFEPLPDELDFPTMERRMLDLWAAEDTFERLRAKNADGPRWSFFDGPITANNPMGVHHAWGRTYKDVYQRYRAMRGYHQRYQNGFDCQGLWLEVEVEKDLGFNSKRDIEAFGLEAFADACRERVETFSGVQTRQSVRLGQWMDWDNSYYTHSDTNIEHIWHFLRRCNERGWIAAAQRAMPWCARCGTALSQHELIDTYEEVDHDAVYVRLPVQGRPDTWLLIWTTTPWTLAANVAAAVHPDLTYAEVLADDGAIRPGRSRGARRVWRGRGDRCPPPGHGPLGLDLRRAVRRLAGCPRRHPSRHPLDRRWGGRGHRGRAHRAGRR